MATDRERALAEAEADEDAGRLEQAERRYEQLIAEEGGDGWLWLRLARVRGELEDWKGAIEAAEEGVARFDAPEPRAVLRSRAGLWWLELSEPQEAERELRASLRDKRDPGTLVFLNEALLRQGRGDEARRCLEEALELDPGYEEAHYNLGCDDKLRGDLEAAERRFRRAIELDPDYAQAHAELGFLLDWRGDEGALAVLQRAVDLDPGQGWSRLYLANALWKQDRLDEAEQQYEAAVAACPDWSSVHWTYADFLASERGARERATEHFKRALALGPDQTGVVHFRFGKALLRWGARQQALAQLRAAAAAGHQRAAELLEELFASDE